MNISRRVVLGGAAAAAGVMSGMRVGWTQTVVSAAGGTVTSLSDGKLILPEAFVMGGMPPDEAHAILAAAGLSGPAYEVPCNVTLWQSGDATVLFDTGAGPDFMESAGRLLDALDAIGVSPQDVTHVVFTHGHPDHLWGVLDEFDEPLFSNAQHLMGEEEHAYWTDPATADSIGAERQTFAAGAARRLGTLGDLVQGFGDGDQLLPGLAARATRGHTPGHMSFMLGSGDDALLIVGDAIGNGHIAFARPEWAAPADQDPALGIATRMALLEECAGSEIAILGYHLPEGGIGRVERSGERFRFAPA